MIPRLLVACLLGALLLQPVRLYGAPGELDVTFGTGGVTGAPSFVKALVRQSDGKLVAVGGNTSDFALTRYEADGSLDPTFGSGGTVLTDFAGGYDRAEAALLQPDGKIVAVGWTSGAPSRFALARYNPDGSLDPTFGTGGKVETAFAMDARARAAVLEPDGQIVVAGAAAGNTVQGELALARYDPDGSLDASFGANGTVLPNLPGAFQKEALVLQPDGKLVVTFDGWSLARFQANGTLDGTFGAGGTVTTGFGPDVGGRFAQANALALRPDGRLIVVGSQVYGSLGRVAVAQYDPQGNLDPAFGTGGLVATALAWGRNEAFAAALSPDGKLIVAGSLLQRYNPDGGLDPTFGPGGSVDVVEGRVMLLQPDDKIVVAEQRLRRYLGNCPALPDADGDGLGDACDPCTGGGTFSRAKITARRLGPPISQPPSSGPPFDFDERLEFRGRLAFTGPVDPITEGLGVVIEDAAGGAVLGVTIPPGPFSGTPFGGLGWRVGTRRSTYVNEWLTPLAGVYSATVTVRDGSVSLRLKARRVPWPISPDRLPLKATVVFDPPLGETGRCGEATFPGTPGPPPGRTCKANATGTSVTCR